MWWDIWGGGINQILSIFANRAHYYQEKGLLNFLKISHIRYRKVIVQFRSCLKALFVQSFIPLYTFIREIALGSKRAYIKVIGIAGLC